MSSFCFVIQFFCFNLIISAPLNRKGTVYYVDGDYNIVADVLQCDDGVSCGYFEDSLNETGWGLLEIKATNLDDITITDYNRMYAAGLLEGWLTPKEIYYSWTNIWNERGSEYQPYMDQLLNWTTTQYQWTLQQISIHNSTTDPEYEYWQYMNLILAQLRGVHDGYNLAANESNISLPSLDMFSFEFLNGLEEFGDLLHVFDPSKFDINYDNMSNDEFMKLKLSSGSCSGLIKITPTFDDIYFAHSTWTDFYRMNRIYKHYKFNLKLKTSTYHLSMSSFPGTLSSIDDYYLMDSGLASMETTNGIYNNSLWTYLTPQTLFTWQRVRIANALASTGKEWVETFSKYNSGTYNNQWMVLNYGIFKPNEPLKDGTLYILEQIPGNCTYSDETDELERGYWPSYNVAALPYIYYESGTAQQANIHGPQASYDLAPRARIFRRDANSANNMTMIQKLMRYNNYQNDPIENNNPCWAIMCREDLYVNKSRAGGGLDTKIANLEMLQNVYSIAQNGPTHDQQIVFDWKQYPNISHIALPGSYDFGWVELKSVL